jgi:hypothetical protein
MSACMTALKRAAPPTSATFSAPNREMKAAAVNSAVRDPDRVGVTGTRALADLERALPLIAIPIIGTASTRFVLRTRLSCNGAHQRDAERYSLSG